MKATNVAMERLKEASTWLQAKTVAVRGMLLWALFKLLQATVAAAFSFIIVAQAATSGLMRCFGEPAAILKVQAAQMASVANSVAARAASRQQDEKGEKVTGKVQIRAVVADPSSIKPMHVFVDPSKGKRASLHVCAELCSHLLDSLLAEQMASTGPPNTRLHAECSSLLQCM